MIQAVRLNKLFFEVPNGLLTLRDMAIWDIIYEHCSYFSRLSLARLFTVCGFQIYHLNDAFEGQFLCLEALPAEGWVDSAPGDGGDLQGIARHVATFANRYRSKVETWQRRLERMGHAGQRVVAWGAGSKGVAFLNTLETHNQIEYVVDINSRKQGMYIAGTGQQIVSPEFLREYQPDVVIVMNVIYEREIQRLVTNLGITTRCTGA